MNLFIFRGEREQERKEQKMRGGVKAGGEEETRERKQKREGRVG